MRPIGKQTGIVVTKRIRPRRLAALLVCADRASVASGAAVTWVRIFGSARGALHRGHGGDRMGLRRVSTAHASPSHVPRPRFSLVPSANSARRSAVCDELAPEAACPEAPAATGSQHSRRPGAPGVRMALDHRLLL